MANKIEIGIIGTVVAVLLVACLFAIITSDNRGPEIHIDENVALSYTEGQDKSVLLEGVTAYDEKDGDVTSSLRVESMFVVDNVLKVRYAARDKHNNVTFSSGFREVAYTPSAGDSQTLLNSDAVPADGSVENGSAENGQADDGSISDGSGENGNAGDGNTGDNGSEGETPENPDQTGDSGNGDNTTEQPPAVTDATAPIDKEAANGSGIPAIRLTDQEVTIDAGTNPYEIGYVAETYDDSGDVSGRVRVDKGDFDANKQGDYQWKYVVTDKDGNVSEPRYLTVHVR